MCNLILLFCAWSAVVSVATKASAVEMTPPKAWRWGGGLGLDFRSQNDVNPDYSSLQTTPQLFTKVLYKRLGATFEIDQAHMSSSSGSLTVTTTTTSLQLWGRYEFLESWRPFVSLGGGTDLDRIETSFQNSTHDDRGSRLFGGVGGGLSKIFWDPLLTEFELRVSAIQLSRDANWSAVLRLGFEI